MSYSNTLKKHIEVLEEVENNFKLLRDKDASYEQLKNLASFNNKDELINFARYIRINYASAMETNFRYMNSNDILMNKILNLKDEKYINMYAKMVSAKYISADDLVLYDKELLYEIYQCVSKQSFLLDCILKYGIEKKLYKLKDEMNYCANVFKYNSKDYKTDNFYNICDFAITNKIGYIGIDNLNQLMSMETNDELLDYLQFLSSYKVKPKLSLLLENKDLKSRLNNVKELEVLVNEEYFIKILDYLDTCSFTNKEISTLVYKVKELGKNKFAENLCEVLNNQHIYNYLLSFIYPNYNEELYITDTISFYHYILRKGKKKFIKTLNESEIIIKSSDWITRPDIYKILNLNSFTVDEIKCINDMNLYYTQKTLKSFYEKGLRNISFKELKFIIQLSDEKCRLYEEMLDIKVDDRIRLIKDLPDTSKLKDFDPIKISNLLKEKMLSDRINNYVEKIKYVTSLRLTKLDWLKFFLIDGIDSIKEQVKNELDIFFVIDYKNEIKNSELANFEELKRNIYLNSKTYKEFISKISASDEFLAQYSENIYKFFITKMMNVFLTYEKSLSRKSQKDNLVKITKAELSNKLDEVKFFKGDLAKEIAYDISEEQESKWRNNIKYSKGKYIVEEVYDYETVLKMGKNPVSTCMNYNDGCYNYCLLSNFDANKKIIIGKTSDGKICSRAVFRLTKISDTPTLTSKEVNGDKDLCFRDIEDLDKVVESESVTKNEELVLFLEKCYTYLDDSDDIELEMIKLAYEKARIMGVRLMIASGYSMNVDYKKELQTKSKSYIYISKSKNGYQYLDSFSGSTTNDKSSYVDCYGHLMLLQEGMFNERYEERITQY